MTDSADQVTEFQKLTEAFIRFSVRTDEQMKAILASVQQLSERLTQMEADSCALDDRVTRMEPWVNGVRWGLTIAGGAVVLVLVGALIWAVVQSGAGLP